MKKKILSSLLAVCMFVGMAVPAFAASSQSGTNEEITAIGFAKDSYTVKKGADVNLGTEAIAFAGTKKITQEAAYTWSIQNDDKFAFMLDDSTGVVTANEEAGTAVVTVTANDSKVKATIKVIAAKADAVIGASGFTFATTTANLYTGGAVKAKQGDKIEILPTPKGAVFSNAQKEAILIAINGSKTVLDFNALKADYLKADVSVDAVATATDSKITITYGVGAATAGTFPVTFAGTGNNAAAGAPKIAIAATNPVVAATTITGSDVVVNATPAQLAAAFVGKTVTLGTITYKGVIDATNTSIVNFVATTKGVSPTITPITAIATAITGITTTATVAVDAGTPGVADKLSSIVLPKVDANKMSLEVPFPRFDDKGTPSKVVRTISVTGKAAKDVEYINATGSIKIEVGQVESLAKYFKQGPSSANIVRDVTYQLTYADMNADANDYADLIKDGDGNLTKVQGIAVGTNKVTANISLADGTAKEATILVTVVEKGTLPKPADKKPTTPSYAKMVVGTTSKIAVLNAGTVVPVFTSYNDKIVTVDKDGNMKAIAAGTGKVKVVVGETTLYVNVAVTAAPVVVDPGKKPTTPPQTGISLF